MTINKILTLAAGALLASSAMSFDASAFDNAKFVAGLELDMPMGDFFKPELNYYANGATVSTVTNVKSKTAASYVPSGSLFVGADFDGFTVGLKGNVNLWGRKLVDLKQESSTFQPWDSGILAPAVADVSKFEIQEKFIDGQAVLGYAMDTGSIVSPFINLEAGLRWGWNVINAAPATAAANSALNLTDAETKSHFNFVGGGKIGAQFAVNDMGTAVTLGLGLSYVQTSALENDGSMKVFTPNQTGLNATYMNFEPNFVVKGVLGIKHAF